MGGIVVAIIAELALGGISNKAGNVGYFELLALLDYLIWRYVHLLLLTITSLDENLAYNKKLEMNMT